MTMVEAAAFGAPSIVNGGGKVGAALMLGEGTGCISVDLERILESNDDDGARREIAERLRTLLTSIVHGWRRRRRRRRMERPWEGTPHCGKLPTRRGLERSDGMKWLASEVSSIY